ncbi:uncharacterized protein LOC131011986 [Salvia miltiorrhiza]|uniref:uncharacterized protein LOC131011986 n=1 Tax=Salvia miltiorrhiza TaxID=226208 RepID=UPI0025ACF081|nr:uncharacterized protein LOC131011986 [Salvia miltiorrhiza]
MKAPHFFFLLLLQLLPYFPAIAAVKYVAYNDAKNTPGGARFEKEIGVPYTLKIMRDINNFVWDTFQQHSEADRKQGYQGNLKSLLYHELTHVFQWNGEGQAEYMILKANYYPPGWGRGGIRAMISRLGFWSTARG